MPLIVLIPEENQMSIPVENSPWYRSKIHHPQTSSKRKMVVLSAQERRLRIICWDYIPAQKQSGNREPAVVFVQVISVIN